jgi:outer membrane biosynthesis protein TonB
MSFNDGELHAIAGLGAAIILGGLAGAMVLAGVMGGDSDANTDEHPLEDMQAIEASIAYKKAPAKQPQKKTKEPEPEKKIEGVSRDDKKKPDPIKKPKEERAKPTQDPKDFKIPTRPRDDDLPENQKPVTDVGEFNDSQRGFAETTSGDPFFRELAADFHENWEFPKILQASGSAAGCLHILADGTIKKTQVKPRSGDPALDDSVERALKKIEKLRNEKPVPVPTHLLKQATTRWICFKTQTQDKVRE